MWLKCSNNFESIVYYNIQYDAYMKCYVGQKRNLACHFVMDAFEMVIIHYKERFDHCHYHFGI